MANPNAFDHAGETLINLFNGLTARLGEIIEHAVNTLIGVFLGG